MLETAQKFGQLLDNDNFAELKKILSPDCKYFIGDQTLIGPEEIAGSYEKNMIEGRKKLDELVWGKSSVEKLSDSEFMISFADYLTHNDLKHTHNCKQKIKINDQGFVIEIKHIDNPKEQESLKNFYKKVGLE